MKIQGLEESEFKTYENLLRLKRATVLQLAKVSGEKRTNLYRELESLIEKGLVSEVYDGKKHYFIAEAPKKLIDFMNNEKEKIKDLLPELESLEQQALERPKIKFYEGKQGIKPLYDELLVERKEIVAFSWPDRMLEASETHEDFVKRRVKLGIPARAIYPDTKFARRRITPNRGTRYSKNLKAFDSTFMISGNKVVTFSHKRWITGVLIENKEIAEGFKAFFNAFWEELGEK